MKYINDGWAYRKNEKDKARESSMNAVLFALKYGELIEIDDMKLGYAHQMVYGHFTKNITLTKEESNYLLAYLDNGNLCFGGTIQITDNKFIGKIYTD